jgi:hypothetical protein
MSGSVRGRCRVLASLIVVVGVGCMAGTGTVAVAGAAGFSSAGTFGGESSAPGGFEGGESPAGIATEAATGDVFVVDNGDQRVEKFTEKGAFVSEFKGGETPGKEFSGEIEGVAVDNSTGASKGDVYVVDAGFGVVEKFKPKAGAPDAYEYVCELTGPGGGCHPVGSSPKPFAGPIGVAVDSVGDVYVTEFPSFGPQHVDVFTSEGADVRQLAGLKEPWSVAVGPSGDVYVAELFHKTVKLTATAGFAVSEFTSHASLGVTVDPTTGDVFVLESEGGDHVGEYEPDGTLIEEFGQGELGSGEAIAFDEHNGWVYVSDFEHHEVHVYTPAVTKLPLPETGPCVGAELTGTLNAQGEETHWYFAYGETEAYGSRTPEQVSLAGTPTPVDAALADPSPNTLYHYQLFAYNEHDKISPVGGGDRTCRTPPVPPLATTLPATEIGSRAATLNATINPERDSTTYRFQYTTAQTYAPGAPDPYSAGQSIPLLEAQAGSGTSEQSVDQRPEELQPATTYHYRVTATNTAGENTNGTDQTFTTSPATPPLLGTGEASTITQSTTTITAAVNPEGLSTTYELQYGTSTSYGTQLFTSAGSGHALINIALTLTGLAPDSTYHYRLTATNREGTTETSDKTFTTTSYPALIVQPAAPLLIPFVAPATATTTGSEGATTTRPKALTNTQKLANALKACAKKPKKQRAGCRKQAQRKYAAATKHKSKPKQKRK